MTTIYRVRSDNYPFDGYWTEDTQTIRNDVEDFKNWTTEDGYFEGTTIEVEALSLEDITGQSEPTDFAKVIKKWELKQIQPENDNDKPYLDWVQTL